MAIPNCCGPNPADCMVTQVLDTTDPTMVAVSSGAVDLAMQESGEEPLGTAQTEVQVVFQVPKAGEYRFEYLYVDAFGEVNPGTVEAVPVIQNKDGFTVQLAGSPPLAGYVLRWRVVVVQVSGQPPEPDPEQSLRINLLVGALTVTVFWPEVRSIDNYGFSELRVELDGDPIGALAIFPMVIHKTFDRFIVKLNQAPNNGFYYLVARSP